MKIAIAQLNFLIGDFQGNVDKMLQSVSEAKSQDADIICFSELSTCGYPPRDFLEFDDFIELAEQAIALNPNNQYAITSLSYYYANLDNVEKTSFYAEKISEKGSGENQFFIAAAYARLNMNKAALRYLEFAIINNYSIAEITSSPLLDNFRHDSQYRELITKALK